MDFEQLSEMIRITMKNPELLINLNSKLKDDLGLCSFDMMILLAEIQAKTDLKVQLDCFKADMTVEDFLNVIMV